MTQARRQKAKTPTLVGTWVNGDEYEAEVEYQVSRGTKGFVVQAVDRFDGEKAEVYDIKWDGEALTFATHWPSTGRFVKCRFLAVSPNRVDFTYTYTQQEMWHRKRAEVPIPNPPLSLKEATAFKKLSERDKDAIDAAILSCAHPHWQKVAMLVTLAEKKLAPQFPQFSYILYAKRIRLLVKQGQLESQGDLRYMRFSEVRLPDEN